MISHPPTPEAARSHGDAHHGAALAELRGLLGAEQVESAPRTPACLDGAAEPGADAPLRVWPEREADCRTLVEWANRHRWPLYPVSRGRNWGYGTSRPTRPQSAIVDLSRMDRIVDFDAELGIVTLEPGVSQQQLRAFLDARGAAYLVPVTGAGPEASIVGNALERGYGITPYADHFGALTSLRAVLGNGEMYQSPLSELGAPRADRCFKWGLGPYVEGLFSQGGFGLVTQASIALAPVSEVVEAFVFTIKNEADLESTVGAVRKALAAVGANTGSINLMNARRVLSMTEPYPHDRVAPGEVMEPHLVAELARRHGLGPWVGIGSIYAASGVARETRRHLRRALKPVVRQLRFVSPGKARLADRVLRLTPGVKAAAMRRRAGTMAKALDNFAGRPSEVALPLCYWKRGAPPPTDTAIDPARDGCGLIWYSPLVVADPATVRRYNRFVEQTCVEHGIEPLITLTSLSPQCFDSTVPLLFQSNDAEQTQRAHACYEALLERGRSLGFMPYRLPTAWMNRLVSPEHACWRTVSELKAALDPNDVIAPGRYSP